MLNELLEASKQAMQLRIEGLIRELAKIRTGRAHPSILEGVQVEYYGNPAPLAQVANINTEGARMLVVTPWEKDMVAPIERAIINSDLGLNPAVAGMVIRVPMPPLTEERRRALGKRVKEDAEQARVQVRNLRRQFNTDVKSLLKDKELSEDECHRAQADIQQITDEVIEQIDQLCSKKERDLMVID